MDKSNISYIQRVVIIVAVIYVFAPDLFIGPVDDTAVGVACGAAWISGRRHDGGYAADVCAVADVYNYNGVCLCVADNVGVWRVFGQSPQKT